MAKSKQQTSAAQRREQERQQRQQRLESGKNKRRSRKRAPRNNPWPLLTVILVLVAVVIGGFFLLSRQSSTTPNNQNDSGKAFKSITSLDPTLLTNVGTGDAQNLMKALPANANVPNGPNGKPMVLYVGADYCPYCAAQRWSTIIALSRFGTFGQVDGLTSSEGNYITYTFHKSTYTSQYVDFVPVETTDNQNNPLDTPTAEQQQLLNTYNAPPYTDANSKGSIPFLLIGNKQTSTGAYYSPAVLSGVSYTDVVSQLKDPNSSVARGMLGAANYLTAAICQATDNKPANVCTTGAIPTIQQSLPKPGSTSGTAGNSPAAIDMPYMAVTTRRFIA